MAQMAHQEHRAQMARRAQMGRRCSSYGNTEIVFAAWHQTRSGTVTVRHFQNRVKNFVW